MPLNRKMRKVKSNMQKEYGKKKGTRVFYAWENKQRKKEGLGFLRRK